ncbi:hypothetical protein [Rheinheimera sp. WS51]|uniref:hypothetical protein n=1 Tax=Rheinheimera sp. WS51 TaxID=3425886 RepID=UPI003D900978
MQFLKSFFILICLSVSLSVSADKESGHIKVNFYTLASMHPELDGKKIALRGWIAFYDYGNYQKVLLFPSQASRDEFNIQESVKIDIVKEDFEAARQYLSNNIVIVYGTYKSESLDNIKLFGRITKVEDIDIVSVD